MVWESMTTRVLIFIRIDYALGALQFHYFIRKYMILSAVNECYNQHQFSIYTSTLFKYTNDLNASMLLNSCYTNNNNNNNTIIWIVLMYGVCGENA